MKNKRLGISSALFAYTLWGILGLFWELLHTVPPLATLSYRVIWSLVTILFVITIQKDWHNMLLTVINLIKNKRIYYIAMSSLFISLNWFIYIYMVTHHQATEASLGYYIMPIMNVVVAILFLHEKLTKYSTLALIFVIIGVTVLTINTGSIPITTIIMAASFCLYGLIKKQVPLPSTMSLALETLFTAPFAILYLILCPYNMAQHGVKITALIILSGIITVIPLLLFSVATKNTNFITLSFIQYLNPSIQLFVAVFILGEKFDFSKFVVFLFIWIGILIFIIGSNYNNHKIKNKRSA